MGVDQLQPSDTTASSASLELAEGATPTGLNRPRVFTWWTPLWLFVFADLCAVLVTTFVTGRSWAFTAVAAVGVVLSLRMVNLYQRVLLPTVLSHVGRMAMGGAAGSLAAAAVTGASSSQAARFAIVLAPALFVGRAVAYRSDRRASMSQPHGAVIVGTGAAGQELVTRLIDHPEYGIVPLGFLDSDPAPLDPNLPVTLLGALPDLPEVLQRVSAQRIFLDSSSVTEQELSELLDSVVGLDIEISVLPALAQRLSSSVVVEGVAGSTVLSYRRSRHRGVSWAVKRGIDIVGALVMLVATMPICALTAVAIKLDSRGPVLFKQVRVGRYGRPFTIYKFRSMQVDADERKTLYLDLNAADGPYFKLERDPRTTRVGRIIRRYSIDEIPQVLNVLRGEMSLVGPRPALEAEVAEYPDWFRRRLAVRPGLSGLWQVSGRFLVPFAEATRLDVSYVDHWSLGLDLQILARTPAVVMSGRGAR